MGPMGNYMTLLQLARGRGGYGGPQGYGGYGGFRPPGGNMYGAAGQMAGMYGAPPPGAFGPSGGNMMGAAGNMAGAPQGAAAPPGMGAHLSAEAKKQELMAQGMSEEQAHRGAMDTYSQMSGQAPAAPPQGSFGPAGGNMMGAAAAMQGGSPWAAPQFPGMNMAYNPMGLRGRRRFY